MCVRVAVVVVVVVVVVVCSSSSRLHGRTTCHKGVPNLRFSVVWCPTVIRRHYGNRKLPNDGSPRDAVDSLVQISK